MGVVDDLIQAREVFERREWVAADATPAASGDLVGNDFDNLGTAAFLLGRKNDCVLAYQRAYNSHLEAGDPLSAVRSAYFLAMELFTNGEPAVASGWVSRGARLLDEHGYDVVERGYLLVLATFRHIVAAEWDEAITVGAQVTEYGRRFRDPDLLAMGLSNEGRLALHSGRVAQGLAMLDEAMVGIAGGEVSPIFAGEIYCSMIEACQEVSDFGRAAAWTQALSTWCDSQPGLLSFTGQCAVHRGQIMRLHGAYAEALDEFERATQRYLAAGTPEPAGFALAERGEVLRIQGEYAAAESAYTDAVSHGYDPQPGLALLWLARGRESAAVGAMQRLLAEPRDPIQRTQVIPAAVDILIQVGRTEEAAPLIQEMRATVRGIDCDALQAMANCAAGHLLLAKGDAAEALPELRRAARLWTRLSAPYDAARCRVLVGRALRALGDEQSAISELSAARRALADLGAAPAERAAAQLVEPAAPGGLTPREIEVLRLVAAGRTNPEIAAMLVLSEKTVARHLSNIFTKINVTSRTAAAAFAFENRVV